MVNRAEAATLLEPGTIVGRYELIRRLEVGGMAEIYLARATGIEGFEKHVVLKRILPHHAVRRDFVDMFLDEARMAAALHHPNIAQVYDIGNDPSGYFFTMEYVDGKDLRHVRRAVTKSGDRMPMAHALAIILGAAAGLHAAHEARRADGRPLNIVHRDVSPANILITFDGCVKLIDFGIAKAAYRQTETRSGVLKGKSSFMSPEQCLGETVDRRSDVFSLGILLYELTTGAHAFRGRSAYDTMTKIAKADFMPPALRVQGYPSQLEEIVLRALKREPDERYQTAQDMFLAIDEFARAQQLPVSPFSLGAYIQRMFPDEGPSAVVESARTTTYDSGPVRRSITDVGYPRATTMPFEKIIEDFDPSLSDDFLNDVSGELDDFSGGLTIPRERAETIDVRTPAPTRLEEACQALVVASTPPVISISADSVAKPLPSNHRMESAALTSVVARPDIPVADSSWLRKRWWVPASAAIAAIAAAAVLVVVPHMSNNESEAAAAEPAAATAVTSDERVEDPDAELLRSSLVSDAPEAAPEPEPVETAAAEAPEPEKQDDARDSTSYATPEPRTRASKRRAPRRAAKATKKKTRKKTTARKTAKKSTPKRADTASPGGLGTLPDESAPSPAKASVETAEAAPAKNRIDWTPDDRRPETRSPAASTDKAPETRAPTSKDASASAEPAAPAKTNKAEDTGGASANKSTASDAQK